MVAVERASLVKRSEMDFSCRRGGSRICTSGSRAVGSWIISTADAANTTTGIDCVMVVSRSWANPSPGSARSESSGLLPVLLLFSAASVGNGPFSEVGMI